MLRTESTQFFNSNTGGVLEDYIMVIATVIGWRNDQPSGKPPRYSGHLRCQHPATGKQIWIYISARVLRDAVIEKGQLISFKQVATPAMPMKGMSCAARIVPSGDNFAAAEFAVLPAGATLKGGLVAHANVALRPRRVMAEVSNAPPSRRRGRPARFCRR